MLSWLARYRLNVCEIRWRRRRGGAGARQRLSLAAAGGWRRRWRKASKKAKIMWLSASGNNLAAYQLWQNQCVTVAKA